MNQKTKPVRSDVQHHSVSAMPQHDKREEEQPTAGAGTRCLRSLFGDGIQPDGHNQATFAAANELINVQPQAHL